MNYLAQARMAMQNIEEEQNEDTVALGLLAAMAHAAIAQAEQLKRLNDMLANYFEIIVDGAITNERK